MSCDYIKINIKGGVLHVILFFASLQLILGNYANLHWWESNAVNCRQFACLSDRKILGCLHFFCVVYETNRGQRVSYQ